jgi:hypothetical protein
MTMKIIIHDVSITSRAVDVASRCPKCKADLTHTNTLDEGRLCETVANAHIDPADADNALATTDSCDDEPDYRATLRVRCIACSHELAISKYTLDGVEV